MAKGIPGLVVAFVVQLYIFEFWPLEVVKTSSRTDARQEAVELNPTSQKSDFYCAYQPCILSWRLVESDAISRP